jgi:large subunit ribosomal protein L23
MDKVGGSKAPGGIRLKDPHMVLLHPLMTEKAVKLIETENKLTFIVARDASRADVKRAVETLFEVRVSDVKTQITADGRKRAYVKLAPEFMADEIATKLGVL